MILPKHVALLISLPLVASAWAAEKTGADSPPAMVVKEFVDAIRAGSASRLQSTILAPTSKEHQEGLQRWIKATSESGAKLGAELKPVTDSKIAGEFAVVRGGFGPTTFMRLRKVNGVWKILAPGDAKQVYGLPAMDALNLSSLEKWADREWKGVPPPPPSPPAVEPETKEDDAPVEVVPAASAELSPVVAVVSPLLADCLTGADADRISESVRRTAMRMLLDTGDGASALRVFEGTNLYTHDEVVKGRVFAMLPGGLEGAEARKRMKRGITWGMIEGASTQLTISGNETAAIALLHRDTELSTPHTYMTLMQIRPTAKLLAALEEEVGGKVSSDGIARIMVFAYTAFGQPAKADQLLQVARQSRAAVKADRDAKVPIYMADDRQLAEIELAMAYGLIFKGEIDAAQKLIDDWHTKLLAAPTEPKYAEYHKSRADASKLLAYRSLIAARAHKGDAEGVTASFEQVKSIAQSSNLRFVPAYVHARAGAVDKAEQLIPTKSDRAMVGTTEQQALVLGLIAAGLTDAGKPAEALAIAQRARALADQAPDARQKCEIASNFLITASGGPEAIPLDVFTLPDDRLPVRVR